MIFLKIFQTLKFSVKKPFFVIKNYFSIIDPKSIQKWFEYVLKPEKHSCHPEKSLKSAQNIRLIFVKNVFPQNNEVLVVIDPLNPFLIIFTLCYTVKNL